ncbi:HAMP domain-containing sensor histidine kinase [Stappia sp. MMSF_3263]|uniref:sensor histidine kinase n=1 Tax=Stappia sp. MMSF_3263 TaxID=3046693 RepID=UPI00273D32B2|nr:HAMP domain-containing sensor histidine kinase [Stappia sp. MMSF_3263]
MRHGSLRLRLLLAGAVSILLALALSAAGLVLLFERHVERRIDQELSVHLDQLIAGLDRPGGGALDVARPPGDPRFALPLSGLYWRVEQEGLVLRSRSLWDGDLALPPDDPADGELHRHAAEAPDGARLLALERRISLPERLGGGTARVAVALDRAEIDAAVRAFAFDLVPYLAVLALFLLAAAFAQVSVGLSPLKAVRDGLAAIRSGDRRRLGDAFPDEIRPLAGEFDGLIAAREAQVASARARAGDLAHGLRTPLQVLAGDVERLRTHGESEIAGEIETVATAMRRHVERELVRARIASGRAAADLSVGARPADVARSVVAVVARTPAGSRLDWRIDIPPLASLRIDPDDLAEALGNLAENAARHARSRVAFTLEAEPGAGMAALVLRDDGPGMARERIAELVARGGRLDLVGSGAAGTRAESGRPGPGTGSGAGLGLAIVTDIAEAWGGRLSIGNSDEGEASGLEVRLHLPCAGAG